MNAEETNRFQSILSWIQPNHVKWSSIRLSELYQNP